MNPTLESLERPDHRIQRSLEQREVIVRQALPAALFDEEVQAPKAIVDVRRRVVGVGHGKEAFHDRPRSSSVV